MKNIWTYSVLCCALICLVSCNSNILTPSDTKYISQFNDFYFTKGVHEISANQLALYVDYSTCIALGQNSPFFQALVPSWANAARRYYSIEGDSIREQPATNTFQLLRTIHEVNYADLKSAINRMAKSNTESVLLTDGEYFQKSIAQGNINNPYMADALKTWLKKGHDVFFLSEPYQEPNNGQMYNKKRFYIIFTDTRLRGNIMDRITQTVNLSLFPTVEMFHLSADHPHLLTANGQTTLPNQNLSATVTGFGAYEIQDWPISWKDGIEPLIVNAVNPTTGTPLPDGEPFSSGLKLDRNAFGGYRITNVAVKAYNINSEYSDFYNALDAKTKPNKEIAPAECQNFVKVDEKEFKRHGIINLHFDTQMYNPETALNGAPFNYTKFDICVSSDEPLFDQYKDIFTFDSIDLPGQKNVSVASSVEQCLTDPDIKAMISNCPIYTIYVKSSTR